MIEGEYIREVACLLHEDYLFCDAAKVTFSVWASSMPELMRMLKH